jgi:hypothetical protein
MKPLCLSMGPLYVRIVLCPLDVDATPFLQQRHLQSYGRTTRVRRRGRGSVCVWDKLRRHCQLVFASATGWNNNQTQSLLPIVRSMYMDFLDRWLWLLGQKLLKKLLMAHHGHEQRRGQEWIQWLLHLSIPSTWPTKTRGIRSTKTKPVGPEARMFRDTLWSWWFDVRRSTFDHHYCRRACGSRRCGPKALVDYSTWITCWRKDLYRKQITRAIEDRKVQKMDITS